MFEGKSVLITGAGTGIGRATALKFAKLGANTILTGRRLGPVEETASMIAAQSNERVLTCKTDISKSDEVQSLFQTITAEFGRLDSAFFNAGVGFGGSILDQSPKEFEEQLNVNCLGLWLCLKNAIKVMQGRGGSIVNNLSVHSMRTIFRDTAAYTASKHAALALTKAAAMETAELNIRVNGVAPGPVLTDMLRASSGVVGGVKGWAERVPMKRVGVPEEIAEAVTWLASDNASFVTGAILNLDGGFLAT